MVELNTQEECEFLRLFLKNSLASTVGITIISTLIFYVSYDYIEHSWLLLWYFTIVFSLSFRTFLALRFNPNKSQDSCQKMEYIYNSLSLFAGIVFSIGVTYMFLNSSTNYQIFYIIMVSGITAGAVATLSYNKLLSRTYIFVILTPMIYAVTIQDKELYDIIALSMLLYLILLYPIINNYHNGLRENVKTRLALEKAEKENSYLQKSFSSIFKEAPYGIFTYDLELKIKDVNKTFAKVLGVNENILIGLDLKSIKDKSVLPALFKSIEGKNGFYEGKYVTHFLGEKKWINLQTTPLYGLDNKIIGGIGIANDVTKQKQLYEQIEHQAHHDGLTNLMNKATFQNKMEEILQNNANNLALSAILFLDIDKFKDINDNFGHKSGDEVLKIFANRIMHVLKKDDMIARFGGDEFVVFVNNLSSNVEEAEYKIQKISDKLHKSVQDPINIDNKNIKITISIGVRIISKDDKNLDEILKNSDDAMYESKKAGRNTTTIF